MLRSPHHCRLYLVNLTHVEIPLLLLLTIIVRMCAELNSAIIYTLLISCRKRDLDNSLTSETEVVFGFGEAVDGN